MKLLKLSPAARKALKAWEAGKAAAVAPSPSYSLCTASGLAAACATFTGAYRAIRCLPAQERETARIYDEDGYCMYR